MRRIGVSRNLVAFCAFLLVAGCDSNTPSEATSEPEAGAPGNFEIAASFPDSLAVIGDGYPATGGTCRRLGESEATSNWLDSSAILVGCPTESSAKTIGGKIVGKVQGITIVSIPTNDENAGIAENGPPSPKTTVLKDFIRSKGGLEDKCKDAVAKQGTKVIGTNRIEESQAAIEIYVNVEGASAPWRCLGYKNGSIGEVSFTGDEGAL